MIANAESMQRPKPSRRRKADPGADLQSFVGLSLSTAKVDQQRARAARALCNAIESLVMLTSQERRGFILQPELRMQELEGPRDR